MGDEKTLVKMVPPKEEKGGKEEDEENEANGSVPSSGDRIKRKRADRMGGKTEETERTDVVESIHKRMTLHLERYGGDLGGKEKRNDTLRAPSREDEELEIRREKAVINMKWKQVIKVLMIESDRYDSETGGGVGKSSDSTGEAREGNPRTLGGRDKYPNSYDALF